MANILTVILVALLLTTVVLVISLMPTPYSYNQPAFTMPEWTHLGIIFSFIALFLHSVWY